MNRLLALLPAVLLLVAACDSGGGCPESGCLDEASVPAGAVSMGCDPAVDAACEPHETPIHQATVPAFRIDRLEVTAAQYASFLNANAGNDCGGQKCVNNLDPALPVVEADGAWTPADGMAQHPVTHVTWHGASAFCAWRGQELCTEAQWARAARGDDGRRYPWGNADATCERAHKALEHQEPGVDDLTGCGTGATAPVGSYPDGASPFGVQDLSGNVWEWVADDWHAGFEGAPTDGTAWVDAPARNNLRMRRGGGADDPAANVRASHRWNAGADNGVAFLGFRCCRWE